MGSAFNGPGDREGREGAVVRHTICDICSPDYHCGIDAYVKDGKVLEVEGTKGFPRSNGKLCAKGASNRQYIYREDRIRTPMRRVGARERGTFKPVLWEDAIDLAAQQLLKAKMEHGAQSTVWMCGYPKWFRPFLQRLAYQFGSPNYITGSSACHNSKIMAHRAVYGTFSVADISNADLLIAWGWNPYHSAYQLGQKVNALLERGGKLMVIDPRNTVTAQRANLFLRPRLGTDCALAHAMAKVIIDNRWTDDAFIQKHVFGYEAYKQYVNTFDLKTAEQITGIPAEDIYRAARLFAAVPRAAIHADNSITHQINGFNTTRAILALSVITGRVGQKGTQLLTEGRFSHFTGGVIEKEREFTGGVYPRELRAVGEEQFPLWSEMFLEKQGMSLASCIRSKKPYPMKAAVCFGVNHMMYPESREFLRQLASLDFVLADDLFWTQTCEIADLVLPACSSFERSQVLCYDDRYLFYTSPVIEPLFESKDDVEIIRLLAQKLCPQDKLLCAGYDHCMRYMLDAVVEDWEAFRSLDTPMEITMQNDEDAGGGQIVRVHTSTKKIELYSQTVARIEGLDPLPRYIPPLAATEEYPLIMSSGARIPNAINSRLHKCRWPRALRADILVDIHPQDARQLGIVQGDKVRIITEVGSICVKANITTVTNIGEVQIFEGYEWANINDILPEGSLDPYTGFPSYKQFPVRVEKVGKETTI